MKYLGTQISEDGECVWRNNGGVIERRFEGREWETVGGDAPKTPDELKTMCERGGYEYRAGRGTKKIARILSVLEGLPRTGYPPCNRRNGRPADGWTHGYAALSRAIKQTNLPWNYYWSGHAPTPSTQYPKAIVEAVRKAGIAL